MEAELEKLLQNMYKKRFLNKGVIQVERFEEMNFKVREFNQVESIGYLCKILEDDSGCISATDEVLETILILVNNYKEEGLMEVFKATSDMIETGRKWAVRLHWNLIADDDIYKYYCSEIRNVDDKNRQFILDIINSIAAKYDYLEDRIKNINILN